MVRYGLDSLCCRLKGFSIALSLTDALLEYLKTCSPGNANFLEVDRFFNDFNPQQTR